jgi:Uma2 family endonuclease
MPAATVTPEQIWSDEAFLTLPRDGHRYEIINGELVDMGNSGALHGNLAIILRGAFVTKKRRGEGNERLGARPAPWGAKTKAECRGK